MKLSYAFLVAAVAGGLGLASVEAGAGGGARSVSYTGADATVVIKRAANFGNHSNISLYIDGRLASVLGYGRSYQGDLAPGLHPSRCGRLRI